MVNGINKGLPRMAASNKLLGDIKVKAAFGITSNCQDIYMSLHQ